MSAPRERLRDLLAERSFRTGHFRLASGATSPFYIDCRTTTLHAEGQALLGPVACDALENAGLRPRFVGGLTMGADPLSCALAAESWRRGRPVHAFSVRKRAKEHGRGKRIEGCFEEGGEVVITEDVVTTGSSALEAATVVREAGGEVLTVLALVDRGEGGREALERAGLALLAIYTARELGAAREGLAGPGSGSPA